MLGEKRQGWGEKQKEEEDTKPCMIYGGKKHVHVCGSTTPIPPPMTHVS